MDNDIIKPNREFAPNEWEKTAISEYSQNFNYDLEVWTYVNKLKKGQGITGRLLFYNVLNRLMHLMPSNPKMLEIGLGSCASLYFMTGKDRIRHHAPSFIMDNVHYTGIDIMPQMVAIAKEAFPEYSFFQMSAENLLFGNETFDIVYCRDVVEHQRGFERILTEMYRCAKRLVFFELFLPLIDKDSDEIIFDPRFKSWRENKYSKTKLVDYLKKLGSSKISYIKPGFDKSDKYIRSIFLWVKQDQIRDDFDGCFKSVSDFIELF